MVLNHFLKKQIINFTYSAKNAGVCVAFNEAVKKLQKNI